MLIGMFIPKPTVVLFEKPPHYFGYPRLTNESNFKLKGILLIDCYQNDDPAEDDCIVVPYSLFEFLK